MAAESWVTIGGFIATTASAVAAFFAVKQTMLQRTISTKPQIIVNNEEVKTICSPNSTFTLIIEDTDFYYDIPILIKNVGLGTALNIKYNWSFDYQKHIKLCGFKEIKEDPVFTPVKIQSKEWDKCYHFENENRSVYKYFKFIRHNKFNHYSIKKNIASLSILCRLLKKTHLQQLNFHHLYSCY